MKRNKSIKIAERNDGILEKIRSIKTEHPSIFTFNARGQPYKLSQFASQPQECSIEDFEKCKKTFENILEYSKSQLVEQISSKERYAILRYHATPYSSAKLLFGSLKH